MIKVAPMNFRIALEHKKQFFENTKKLGISASDLLNMFIVAFNKSKKITFSLDGIIELEPFIPDNVENIMDDFKKTKKYNTYFLKDLENGLKRSKLNKAI